MVNMKTVIRLLSLLLIVITSCSLIDQKMNIDEFVNYVESKRSGFKKSVTTGDIEYIIQYKPVEYIIYKEMHGNIANEDSFENRRKELESTVWFNVYLKSKNSNVNPLKGNVSGLGEYNQNYQYLLTQASNDFKMYYGNNSVEAEKITCHFETNYGLTPTDIFVLGFKIPDAKPVKDMTLVYDDKLYNNGIIKVKILQEHIANTPTLIL